LSDAKPRLHRPQGFEACQAVSERPAVQVALDGEPGAVTFRCLILLNPIPPEVTRMPTRIDYVFPSRPPEVAADAHHSLPLKPASHSPRPSAL
jgi:hypothetical protein